jgi:hypothetical protein
MAFTFCGDKFKRAILFSTSRQDIPTSTKTASLLLLM